MDSLNTRVGRPLWGLLIVTALSACSDIREVPFRVTVDDRGCTQSASEGAPITLFLAPLVSPGAGLCLLDQATLDASSSTPSFETGADLDAEEAVIIALVRDSGCIECYGLLRVLLRQELTDYTIRLESAPSCEIPPAAREALALPSGPLPPTTPCE